LRVFGPSRAAAQLESSKAFAKDFMQEHGIPTAEYASFTDFEEACDFVHQFGKPMVVKADGLAAGKGVILCDTAAEAEDALHRIMVAQEFGKAGAQVVIEERLIGPEVSALAFCDGKAVAIMPLARDHKRVFDGDLGPNTGGMGAYAPVPDVDDDLPELIVRTVLQPVVNRMAERGTSYIGVLYAGLMLTADGPKVLEFNCRFGDPETQVILPLLDAEKIDLVDILWACTEGRLHEIAHNIRWREGACATVVLAAEGYPSDAGKYATKRRIDGLEGQSPEVVVFHAGTTKQAIKQGENVVTNGGRVLAVSGYGESLEMALRRAYTHIEQIHFEGMHYRRDIGRRIVKSSES
jgi:phosphoribosylamine--glycine ligase